MARDIAETTLSRSIVDPFRNLMNAGEKALFTVELDRVAFRLGDRGRVKPGEFGASHHHNLRARWQGQADAHVGADQQATQITGSVLLLRLAEEDACTDGEQVGGERFMEY